MGTQGLIDVRQEHLDRMVSEHTVQLEEHNSDSTSNTTVFLLTYAVFQL